MDSHAEIVGESPRKSETSLGDQLERKHNFVIALKAEIWVALASPNGIQTRRALVTRTLLFDEIDTFAYGEKHQLINGFNFSTCTMQFWPDRPVRPAIRVCVRRSIGRSDPRLIDTCERLTESVARKIVHAAEDGRSVSWGKAAIQADGLWIRSAIFGSSHELAPYEQLVVIGREIFRNGQVARKQNRITTQGCTPCDAWRV